MKRSDRDVDEFLQGLGGRRGEEIRSLDSAIRARTPGHARHLYTGGFWSGSDQEIVGYGVLDYEKPSGEHVEWFLVGLAEQKRHISMYVNAVVDGRYLLRDYESRLGKAKVGSASIAFGSIDDIDLDVLMQLVERASRLA